MNLKLQIDSFYSEVFQGGFSMFVKTPPRRYIQSKSDFVAQILKCKYVINNMIVLLFHDFKARLQVSAQWKFTFFSSPG